MPEFTFQKLTENISHDIFCMLPIIIIFGCSLPIIFIFQLYNRSYMIKHWGEYARKRNLSLQKGWFLCNPRVTGKYKGFDYLLYTEKVNDYRNRTYTYIALTLPFLVDTGSFEFRNISLLFTIGQGKRFVTGDKEFDEKFTLIACEPEKVKEFFTPQFRRRLLDFPRDIKVWVNHNSIKCRMKLVINKPEILDIASDLLVSLAGKLAGDKEMDIKMSCPACGKEVLSYYRFCKYCGKTISM